MDVRKLKSSLVYVDDEKVKQVGMIAVIIHTVFYSSNRTCSAGRLYAAGIYLT